METTITNNDIIDAKIEGITLCLHYLQHKKDVHTLINDLIAQKETHEEANEVLSHPLAGSGS